MALFFFYIPIYKNQHNLSALQRDYKKICTETEGGKITFKVFSKKFVSFYLIMPGVAI